jgi:hypothetical protein
MRHPFRRGGVARRGGIVVLAVVVASIPALASIGGAAVTTPTAGAVVRDVGPVTIHEDTGGQWGSTIALLCDGSTANRSPRPSAQITVRRQSDNTVVSTTNYVTPRGVLDSLTVSNSHGAFDATWDTTNATPGIYTIKSTAVNVTRASALAQCVGTTVTRSEFTVEFRPWQHTFRDILGTGSVSMNTSPKEFSYKVKGASSAAVIDGSQAMHVYEVGDPSSFTLPPDPTACTTNPQSCLPPTARECPTGNSACDGRLVVINYQPNVAPPNKLVGIFDLDTKAFIASASANGTTRILASLGPDLDAELVGVLGGAVSSLQSGTGIDVANLLATKVRVRLAGPQGQETSIFLSLGELLTIVQGAPTGPNGINVLAPFTADAGVIGHFVFGVSPAGSTGLPYSIEASQLAPTLPNLAITGGPLVHIEGDYPSATSAPIGSHTVALNADTAPDETKGLPAWIPLVSEAATLSDSDIDFVGYTLVLANSATNLGSAGVFKIGIMIGTGAALFGANPLPVGLGDLPLIWDPQSPEVVALLDALNGATGTVLSDPAVQDALAQVLATLPT